METIILLAGRGSVVHKKQHDHHKDQTNIAIIIIFMLTVRDSQENYCVLCVCLQCNCISIELITKTFIPLV